MPMETMSIASLGRHLEPVSRSRYRRLEKLGEGGQGTVFKAFDSHLHRFVAIKEINQDGIENSDDLRREAMTLANLRHPHVVALHDVVQDDDGTQLVMELLEGEDLHSWLGSEELTLEDFRQLSEQTLEAMIAAHDQNIMHRDLKPENLRIIRLAGGRLSVKVMDFGLARISEMARKQTANAAGEIRGSVRYIAPEQLERKPLDARTDLYSLGCIFYKVLCGRTAFSDPKMTDVISAHLQGRYTPLKTRSPDLDPGLCEWVAWLMKRQPEERPASAREALESLRSTLEHIEAGFHINRAIRSGAIPNPTSSITGHLLGPEAAALLSAQPAPIHSSATGTVTLPIYKQLHPTWKWAIGACAGLLVLAVMLLTVLLAR
jgi:eukaryotic-like serine/threonine-protein kinase